jgi:hypothetical protein
MGYNLSQGWPTKDNLFNLKISIGGLKIYYFYKLWENLNESARVCQPKYNLLAEEASQLSNYGE